MRWRIFVALLLIVSPAQAEPKDEPCVSTVPAAADILIPSKRTLSNLSGKRRGQVRLRALATLFSDGRIAFSVTSYVFGPGHELLEILSYQKAPRSLRIMRQWGGEIILNDGVLMRANQTSGYLFRTYKADPRPEYDNDPEVLAKFLAHSHCPIRTAESFEIEAYRPERRHLDGRLNHVLEVTEADPDDSFMHQINNILIPFVTGGSLLDAKLTAIPTVTELPPPLQSEFLEKIPPDIGIADTYLSVLQDDGLDVPGRDVLASVAHKVQHGQAIPIAEYRQFSQLNALLLKTARHANPPRTEGWFWKYQHYVREHVLRP